MSKNKTKTRSGTLAIKWLSRPLLWMSVSVLRSHLSPCSVTHEQSSPGDKDGISVSLAMLNCTPEAGLAVDTVEGPYPYNGDWPWVLWGDQPATWWQADYIKSLSLWNWVTSRFYWKIYSLRKWICLPCPQCFPLDSHDCYIHRRVFPHSFASELKPAEFPF